MPVPPYPELQPSTILVIEDDELSRELLTLLLEAEGYEVLSFHSGDAALTTLRSRPPASLHAILTDLQMPGLTGNPLAAELRQLCGPETLLLAISATQPPPQTITAFDSFLLKPFTAAQLIAALTSSASTSHSNPAENPAVEAPQVQALDEAIFQALSTAMQPAQLQQLYALSLSDTAGRIDRMRAHAAAGDEAAYVREAHTIKGGCGLVGAAEIHSLASAMETGALTTTALLDQISAAHSRLQRILESRLNP